MCPRKIAIDFGTSNTMIYISGEGLVLQEPSVVAINIENNKILAVGYEAQRMIGKTPRHIEVIKPLKHGSIDQFDIAKAMLEKFIKKVGKGGRKLKAFSRAQVLIGVPSDVTQVERKGIEEVVKETGAKQVVVIKSVIAASIGAGGSINKPEIHLVVDIGGGTTDVAAIALGGILVENSIKVGGNNFDAAIIQYVKKRHNINIGEITAENIKTNIGDALGEETKEMEIVGQNMTTGLPVSTNITSREVLEAVHQPLERIINSIKKVIEQCPPESAADILKNGIQLAGGGSLFKNLDTLLEKELQIKVVLVENPSLIVIQGLGITLEHLDLLNSMVLEYNPRDIQNSKWDNPTKEDEEE